MALEWERLHAAALMQQATNASQAAIRRLQQAQLQVPEYVPEQLELPGLDLDGGGWTKVTDAEPVSHAAEPPPAAIERPKPLEDMSSADRKATPICTGVLDYFPDALAAIARVSKAGNDKHNPGQPLHWARDKSTDHADCIVRHQATRFHIDPATGEYHAAEVAWRALAQLQEMEEARMGIPRRLTPAGENS